MVASVKASSTRAWQRMLSGRRLDLLDPSPLDIEIEDIAHGLARVARWNGQTRGEYPYSVAQHSLVVEHCAGLLDTTLSKRFRLAALLHDAPEYVIGDLISPFKAVMGEKYKAVEERLQAAVHVRFGLPASLPVEITKLIKRADRTSAYFEAIHLADFSKAESEKFFDVPHDNVKKLDKKWTTPWPTQTAQESFLQRFSQLSL